MRPFTVELIVPALKTKRMEKGLRMPQLTLPVLAALTPSDVDVIVTEEEIEDVTFKDRVDLVGISFMTPLAFRAYEIADAYRSRGVKVVLGGIHASAVPEEALRHADAVVIGEAEHVWGPLIEDARADRLKRLYRSGQLSDLAHLPLPRRDLLKKEMTFAPYSLQTTRGCPFGCHFCSVTKFFGGTFRTRPVGEVLREVDVANKRNWIFIDDNVVGSQAYARALFRELISRRIHWVGQSTTLLAGNKELLKLAVQSGCRGLFIGFESLNERNLKMVNKGFNKVKDYETSLKVFHDHGLLVCASFAFGFDGDDERVFEKTLEFLNRNKVGVASLTILVPFPGTALFQKLEEEGRILTKDWSKYDYNHAVFRPKLMSPEVLEEGARWMCREFYSLRSIAARSFSHWRHPLLYPVLNLSYRARNRNIFGPDQSPDSPNVAAEALSD
jgi:radical SAM superfamily enzyme YgiQ (UPF0313 family)